MAIHKVPQDVETDDKLIGFLSLKQFIFVVVGLGFAYLTFFFFTKVNPFVSVIWVPPTLIALILGLYQRKDQPAEVYLASALQFYLKPHKRIWSQDGYEERVIVTAPPRIEKHYAKDYTDDQVSSHLGNLSRLMDSRGWASKQVGDWQNPQLAGAAASERLMQPGEVVADQNSIPDVQPLDVNDASGRVAQEMDMRIQQGRQSERQEALQTLQHTREEVRASADDSNEVIPETRRSSIREKVIEPIAAPLDQTPSLKDVAVQEVVVDTLDQQRKEPTPEITVTTETRVSEESKPEPVPEVTEDGEIEIKLH